VKSSTLSLILGTRCLFQAIQRLVKFADIMMFVSINEALWLLHINITI